ncbi:hypothetical protein ACU686_11865 [Yinghuangia aomiensis]
MPPSLRSFLKVTDGWLHAGNFVDRLAGTADLAPLDEAEAARYGRLRGLDAGRRRGAFRGGAPPAPHVASGGAPGPGGGRRGAGPRPGRRRAGRRVGGLPLAQLVGRCNETLRCPSGVHARQVPGVPRAGRGAWDDQRDHRGAGRGGGVRPRRGVRGTLGTGGEHLRGSGRLRPARSTRAGRPARRVRDRRPLAGAVPSAPGARPTAGKPLRLPGRTARPQLAAPAGDRAAAAGRGPRPRREHRRRYLTPTNPAAGSAPSSPAPANSPGGATPTGRGGTSAMVCRTGNRPPPGCWRPSGCSPTRCSPLW